MAVVARASLRPGEHDLRSLTGKLACGLQADAAVGSCDDREAAALAGDVVLGPVVGAHDVRPRGSDRRHHS